MLGEFLHLFSRIPCKNEGSKNFGSASYPKSEKYSKRGIDIASRIASMHFWATWFSLFCSGSRIFYAGVKLMEPTFATQVNSSSMPIRASPSKSMNLSKDCKSSS
jgi:hypothetical protein